MKEKGIPGTYNGIYRNIMRESARQPATRSTTGTSTPSNGIPSKGLLQVIHADLPDAYHVAGTSANIYDPVANITAAVQLRGRPVRLDGQRQQRVLRPARTL